MAPGRNIRRHATLSREDGAIANCQMARRTDLPRKNAAITHFGGSGQTHLSAKKRIFTDFAGVAHLDQVIDFRSAANASFADGCAVDSAVGLDFDVIFDRS